MILILSQSAMEPTTEEVMDWLEALGGRCVRLNGDDLDGRAAVRIELAGDRLALAWTADGLAALGARADSIDDSINPAVDDSITIPLAEVGAVWFRRWMLDRRHEMASVLAQTDADSHKLHYDLRRHLTQESRKLSDFVFSALAGRPWLSHPKKASLNKLDVLLRAARAGFSTPHTLVTSERADLQRFCDRHEKVITKPIGDVDMFVDGERSHFLFTTALDRAAVDALPERFAPSLFQQHVDKEYEVRVFYLAGASHAMAIFSQTDAQTRIDFRHYNRERPNRTVPYRLAAGTAERIRRLMDDLGLETGSLDLLHSRDAAGGGREVFLEINPVGQFGMVSKPCNYRLEKRVAEHLLAKAAAAPAPAHAAPAAHG